MDGDHTGALHAVVMAGGASSRFFPVDKVLCDPTGCGRPMIRQAVDRLCGDASRPGVMDASAVWVVTGEASQDPIRRALAGAGRVHVLVEPVRRNTWPAILWAMSHIRVESPDAILAIVTADHLIGDPAGFRAALLTAAAYAADHDDVVTLGVEPDDDPASWTGFGAVRAKGDASETPARLEAFVEKPSHERAVAMIAEGGWRWNAGMFVARIEVLEDALQILDPATEHTYREIAAAILMGDDAEAARRFATIAPSIPHPLHPEDFADHSIDYAIMMPITSRSCPVRGAVLDARFAWSDLGTWSALRTVLDADANGNIIVGKADAGGAARSTLVAEPPRTIVARDVDGLVIVHAADGRVLVTTEDRAPELRTLVAHIESSPPRPTVELDCTGCELTSDGPLVAAFGVADLAITRAGDVVEVTLK